MEPERLRQVCGVSVTEEAKEPKTSLSLRPLCHVTLSQLKGRRTLSTTDVLNKAHGSQTNGKALDTKTSPGRSVPPSRTARLSRHLQLVVVERPESSSPTICTSITAIGNKVGDGKRGETVLSAFCSS